MTPLKLGRKHFAERANGMLGWALVAALAVALAFTAYYKICTGFSSYDDMGYVMLTEKTFFAEHPLYDQTYTQYGPAYYAYKRLLLAATGLPLSHDSTLLFAAASWILSSLLCAGYVWRATRNLTLTAGALLGVFAILDVLKSEPGHPEGFCVLLLTAALFCASFLRRGRRAWVILGVLGALTGLMGMTKANVGVLACLAFLLWLWRMAPAGRLRSLLFTMILPSPGRCHPRTRPNLLLDAWPVQPLFLDRRRPSNAAQRGRMGNLVHASAAGARDRGPRADPRPVRGSLEQLGRDLDRRTRGVAQRGRPVHSR
jgi:hypothetical protein